jgi:uncharacterized membrane protein
MLANSDVMQRRFRWILVTEGLALFLGFTLFAHALFKLGVFKFHDLTLIADFLANFMRGKSFWISDYGLDHMTIHFTPALFWVAPFFALFDSQFVLIALNIACVVLSAWVHLLFFQRVFERGALSDHRTPFLVKQIVFISIFFIIGANEFSQKVMLSGHYEVFGLPFASLAGYLLWIGAPLLWISLPLLLALGVRVDAGFYFFFMILSFQFFPSYVEGRLREFRIKSAFLCVLCAAYCLLTVKVIMPQFGADPNGHVHWWGSMGTSWGEILRYLLAHPGEVFTRLRSSGLLNLNRSVGFLSLLSLPGSAFAQVPGLLLFLADSPDKKMLDYYNSTFLLPGLFFSFTLGLHRLHTWTARLQKGSRDYSDFILMALLLWAVGDRFYNLPSLPPAGVSIRREAFRDIPDYLNGCVSVTKVAADFDSIVFVPNRYERYLLRNAQVADVVFIYDGANTYDPARNGLRIRRELIESGKFRSGSGRKELEILVREGVFCQKSAPS